MKWLHCKIRRVVPLICAGACRASSIVNSELPATPTPAVARKFLRLRVDLAALTDRGSVIVGLLCVPGTCRRLTNGNPRKELDPLCCLAVSCQVAVLGPVLSSPRCDGRSWL